MATTQEMLASTSNLQQNAQAALPVIPNNGNPAGAYNMPQSAQVPAKPAGPDLSWLQPSAHMDSVNQTLQQLQQNIAAGKQQLPMVQQQQQQAPTMHRPALPVMPQQQVQSYTPAYTPNGVVLPQMG